MAKGRETLPRKCECGGRMKYTRQFGRIFSYCLNCTPVSTLTIPAKPKVLPSVSDGCKPAGAWPRTAKPKKRKGK